MTIYAVKKADKVQTYTVEGETQDLSGHTQFDEAKKKALDPGCALTIVVHVKEADEPLVLTFEARRGLKTPGGAVEAGQSTFETLVGEMHEELFGLLPLLGLEQSEVEAQLMRSQQHVSINSFKVEEGTGIQKHQYQHLNYLVHTPEITSDTLNRFLTAFNDTAKVISSAGENEDGLYMAANGVISSATTKDEALQGLDNLFQQTLNALKENSVPQHAHAAVGKILEDTLNAARTNDQFDANAWKKLYVSGTGSETVGAVTQLYQVIPVRLSQLAELGKELLDGGKPKHNDKKLLGPSIIAAALTAIHAPELKGSLTPEIKNEFAERSQNQQPAALSSSRHAMFAPNEHAEEKGQQQQQQQQQQQPSPTP